MFRFAKDVWMFAIPLGVATLLFWLFGLDYLFALSFVLLVFVFYFFRDPERVAPVGDDLIVSPADGKVVKIETNSQSPDHPDGAITISIFLSIFNVHVQRVPVSGRVLRTWYNTGKFLAAWDHKASLDNEQNLAVITTSFGNVGVKQIAGFIARRISCWISTGQDVSKNDHLGLIRFGSRVDLILPPSTEVVCRIGDTVKGGESVMAKVTGEE